MRLRRSGKDGVGTGGVGGVAMAKAGDGVCIDGPASAKGVVFGAGLVGILIVMDNRPFAGAIKSKRPPNCLINAKT